MEGKVAICAIAKNENDIEDWIIYHYMLGIQHFFIYDNGSDFPLEDRLNNSKFKEICTIKNVIGKNRQISSYHSCLNGNKNKFEWIAFLDCDEYIVLKEDENIIEFLNKRDHLQGIALSWIVYGTSFHDISSYTENYTTEEPVFSKYTYNQGFNDRHVKSIVKPKYTNYFQGNPHFCNIKNPDLYEDPCGNKINGPFNYIDSTNVACINHYFCKSADLFMKKKKRGRIELQIEDNFLERYKFKNSENYSEENPHSFCNEVSETETRNRYYDRYIETRNLFI